MKKDFFFVIVVSMLGALILPQAVKALSGAYLELHNNETDQVIEEPLGGYALRDATNNEFILNAMLTSGYIEIPDELVQGNSAELIYEVYVHGFEPAKGKAKFTETQRDVIVNLRPTVWCGDNVCTTSVENITECPEDCSVCGNKICESPTEHALNCPSDCRKFIRGDANRDNRIDTADATTIYNWLYYKAAAPKCMDAADSNYDCKIDVSH